MKPEYNKPAGRQKKEGAPQRNRVSTGELKMAHGARAPGCFSCKVHEPGPGGRLFDPRAGATRTSLRQRSGRRAMVPRRFPAEPHQTDRDGERQQCHRSRTARAKAERRQDRNGYEAGELSHRGGCTRWSAVIAKALCRSGIVPLTGESGSVGESAP